MFRHHQSISPEGQVRSVQTLDLEPPLPHVTAAMATSAGQLYFDFLDRFVGPIIKVDRSNGRIIAVRTLFSLTLLTFGQPAILPLGDDGFAIRYPILDGLVVQPKGRGAGHLAVIITRDQLALEVDGYYARIPGRDHSRVRRLLYRLTQSALHVLIAWRFLDRLRKAPRTE